VAQSSWSGEGSGKTFADADQYQLGKRVGVFLGGGELTIDSRNIFFNLPMHEEPTQIAQWHDDDPAGQSFSFLCLSDASGHAP
jgi:hypothetical protein